MFCVDGFGEKGKPASGNEAAVPPSATLQITLELLSWKTVSEITDDKKVIKKILKEGEGYERPNEGAVVKCKLINVHLDRIDVHFLCSNCWRVSHWAYFAFGSKIDWKAAGWYGISEERAW